VRSSLALVALCGVLASVSTARAATFYVRTNGNDSNDGRSPATAFATVEQAGRSLLNAGDRIVVAPGTYAVANIVPIRNGSAGRPIVFHADRSGIETGDPPGAVILDVRGGPGVLNSAFLLYARKHIVIEGFTIRGASDPAIQVRPDPVSRAPSSDITVRENVVTNGAKTGIEIEATGTLAIHDNTIDSNGGSGVAVNGAFAATVLVQGNVVTDNTANGVILGGVTSASVSGNSVRKNLGSGIVVRRSSPFLPSSTTSTVPPATTAGTIRIEANTVRDSGGYGVSLGLAGEPLLQPVELVANTLDVNASGGATVFASADTWVTDSMATDNGGSGFSVQSFGVGTAVELSGNTARRSDAHGIFVTGARAARIDRNTTEDNRGNGLLVRASDAVVATRNVVRNNADGGVAIGSGPGLVGDCDRDGVVATRDTMAGISIVLGQRSATACSFLNFDDDPAVDVIDLVAQVTHSRSGERAPEVGRGAEVSANVVANNAKVGIAVTARDTVLVQDNETRQSQATGVFVASDGDITLQDNQVRHSGTDGILVSGGRSALVQGNQVDVSTTSGLRMILAGDVLADANVVTGSGERGISIDAFGSALVADNRTEGQGTVGILVGAVGDLQVNNNQALDNGSVGISTTADLKTAVSIHDNRVARSGTDGILVNGGGETVVEGNDVATSTASGLTLTRVGNVVVDANTIAGSGARGISIEASGTVRVTDNQTGQQGAVGIVVSAIGDLQIERNAVHDSGSVGISAAGDARTTIAVGENQVARSILDGILVRGGQRLTANANQVGDSGDNGLRVVGGGRLGARDNVITMSGRSAIVVEAEGEVVVDDNQLTTAGQVGLSLQAPTGKTIEVAVRRNRLAASTLGGIFIDRASAAVLLENQLQNPGTAGVTILHGGRMELSGNEIADTDGHGVIVGSELEPALSLILAGNSVRRSRQTGLNLWVAESVRLESNQIFDAGTVGVAIRAPGATATGSLVGNTVARNPVDGFNVFGVQGALIQNNVLFSNGDSGLVLRGAPNARIVNNLIYANGRFGVSIGTGDTATIASPAAFLASNTFYRNGQFGVVIGTATLGPAEQPLPQSPGALIVNNAFEGNGFDAIDNNGGGIGVARGSLGRMVMAFNFNPDGYSDGIRVSPYDRRTSPGFVDPDGADGILGGLGYADDDFHLRAVPAEERSAAIDAGSGEAADIGITGSCVAGAAIDSGAIDVCFHYGADAEQVVQVTIPELPQFTFVRTSGSVDNDGLSPQNAFASLYDAGLKATSGTTIVIGPGTYREGDIRVRLNVSDVTFLADPSGSLTGDPPGPVLIDATGGERCLPSAGGTTCLPCDDTGFVLVDAPNTTIDGFHITGARQAGIQVRRGSGGAVIRNNVVFSNGLRGIESLIGGSPTAGDPPIDGVSFLNNLVYANGSGGIRVSETVNAVVQNNTVYGNGTATAMSTAIFIGNPNSAIPTRGVVVQRNIVQANRDVGILVDGSAREGYVTGFNVALGLTNPLLAYAGNTPRADSDHLGDALFVDPAGADGILGAAGFRDDDFRLQQGGSVVSPAVDIDYGELDIWQHGTTASSGLPDLGPADAGYHYPLPGSSTAIPNRSGR